MDRDLASQLQTQVAQRWADVSDGNSPEDIARLGAANPAQAVLAYASLRLAARRSRSLRGKGRDRLGRGCSGAG